MRSSVSGEEWKMLHACLLPGNPSKVKINCQKHNLLICAKALELHKFHGGFEMRADLFIESEMSAGGIGSDQSE